MPPSNRTRFSRTTLSRSSERVQPIELISFDGATARDLDCRHVLPSLDVPASRIRHVVLPSTSNAYAAMSFETKLTAWREALGTATTPERS